MEQVLWSVKDKIGIEIELKEVGYEEEVISITRDYFDYNNFVMKSFHSEVVEEVKKIDQKICTGLLLGSAFTFEQLFIIIKEAMSSSVFKQTRANFISPYYKLVNAGWFSKFSRNKIPIQAWTVNDIESIRTLINQQVHSIVTDIPEIAIGIRESLSNVDSK